MHKCSPILLALYVFPRARSLSLFLWSSHISFPAFLFLYPLLLSHFFAIQPDSHTFAYMQTLFVFSLQFCVPSMPFIVRPAIHSHIWSEISLSLQRPFFSFSLLCLHFSQTIYRSIRAYALETNKKSGKSWHFFKDRFPLFEYFFSIFCLIWTDSQWNPFGLWLSPYKAEICRIWPGWRCFRRLHC